MKKITLALVALSISTSANAYTPTHTPDMSFGIDISQPYVVTVDGDGANSRANLNLGFDYRYFTNDSLNIGLRYGIDIEKQLGTARQIIVAPGLQYHWFQGQTWMPYIRTDIPVYLHGAYNSLGNSGQKDMGFGAGGGLAWNLGNQIGIDNLVFRYDFTIFYLFGIGNALNSFNMEFFKFGMDYRF